MPIEDYKGTGQKILVIDDEEYQREIFCKMLEVLGYESRAVASGEEAIAYLTANSADLIMLDMVMRPGINGRETYQKILEIHPHQKAIIVSGYTETEEVCKTQALGAGAYVKKPVQLEKLGLAIKAELASQRACIRS